MDFASTKVLVSTDRDGNSTVIYAGIGAKLAGFAKRTPVSDVDDDKLFISASGQPGLQVSSRSKRTLEEHIADGAKRYGLKMTSVHYS